MFTGCAGSAGHRGRQSFWHQNAARGRALPNRVIPRALPSGLGLRLSQRLACSQRAGALCASQEPWQQLSHYLPSHRAGVRAVLPICAAPAWRAVLRHCSDRRAPGVIFPQLWLLYCCFYPKTTIPWACFVVDAHRPAGFKVAEQLWVFRLIFGCFIAAPTPR